MENSTKFLPCDGCGLPASPEHLTARVQRLEQSTQFRPIHINTLFVALAPPAEAADDFYAPSRSKEFFNPFMDALEISPSSEQPDAQDGAASADLAKLAEFQRRGYYLTFLSECPLPSNTGSPSETIERLSPTLLRRIKFNYRPKQIAPLGKELDPLVNILRGHEIAPVLTATNGGILPTPGTGPQDWLQLFRRAVSAGAQ